MRRLLVFAAILATTLTAAGCTDTTNPANSLAGTYTLRTVDGSPLPITYVNAGYTDQLIAGRIDLDAQGNYIGTTTYRRTYTGQAPVQFDDTIVGYWTLSGNQLTLVDSQTGTQYFGTVSGSTITIDDPYAGVQVFSK
jgi:hypothetical protein